LTLILHFNLHNSYFILALPPPLGREKKNPQRQPHGEGLGWGRPSISVSWPRNSEFSIVSPEFYASTACSSDAASVSMSAVLMLSGTPVSLISLNAKDTWESFRDLIPQADG
jgi:hypothetical protein